MPRSPKAPDYKKRRTYFQTDVHCTECEFETKKWLDADNARRTARNHMRKTGHDVEILVGYNETFSLKRD